MSEQHTPGRLRVEKSTLIFAKNAGGFCISLCPSPEANARRLAACWNLLADVPTEEIEAAANYGASWGKTGLELAALTVKLEQLRTENARLRAELEAVGAGGVQPLRAKQEGWALVPVEPTLEMVEAGAEDLRLRGLPMALLVSASECYRAMLAAAPKAPQQETPVVRALQSAILSGLSHEELLEKAHHLMTLTVNQARTIGELQEAAAAIAAPQQAAPVPPQKPELRVGQVWLTRCGAVAKIESESEKPNAPYPFLCVAGDDKWAVTEDGRYYSRNTDSHADLIELIRDVPQEGGEA